MSNGSGNAVMRRAVGIVANNNNGKGTEPSEFSLLMWGDVAYAPSAKIYLEFVAEQGFIELRGREYVATDASVNILEPKETTASLYPQLSSVRVTEDEIVKRDELLALTGLTHAELFRQMLSAYYSYFSQIPVLPFLMPVEKDIPPGLNKSTSIRQALAMMVAYSPEDDPHSQWVLDQIAQILLADKYPGWVASQEGWGKGTPNPL